MDRATLGRVFRLSPFDEFATATRATLDSTQDLKTMRSTWFGGWNVKETLLAPVAANLMTALVLFASGWVFRDEIRALIAADYPLYCIVEPYNDSAGNLVADLFIVNKTAERHSEGELRQFLRSAGSSRVSPDITLMWNSGPGQIVAVDGRDDPFNAGKGEVEVLAPQQSPTKQWVVRVREIEGEVIMKLRVTTDVRQPIRRAARARLPFRVDYGGT